MNKKVVLWGAGKTSSAFLSTHGDYEVEYMVDNDRTKFNTEFEGIPVRSPMFLRNEDPVVITSFYYFDIYEQLIAMEYPEAQISVFFPYGAGTILSAAALSSHIRGIGKRKSAIRDYISRNMRSVKEFPLAKQDEYLSFCFSLARKAGLIAEFGVFDGTTIKMLASFTDGPVFGFDSFSGLPLDWTLPCPKGAFDLKGQLPQVPDNVTLVKGLFADTLNGFVAENPGPFSFIHIDCDLYESTCDVLSRIKQRVIPGTVIAFDEYLGWEDTGKHEFDAFQEFIASTGLKYEYLAMSEGVRVAVRIV